jgi:hypothetical protein
MKDTLALTKSSGFVVLKDTSSTNEIQALSLSGQTLSLSKGGGAVTLPTGAGYQAGYGIYFSGNYINALDEDPTNELQAFMLNGNYLSLSKGGGTVQLPKSYWYEFYDPGHVSIVNSNNGEVRIGGASYDLNSALGVENHSYPTAIYALNLSSAGNSAGIHAHSGNGGTAGLFSAENATALYVYSNNGPALVTWTGNIGFNTGTPNRRLEVLEAGAPQLRLSESSSNYWELWGGNSLHFDKGAGTYPFTLSAAGNLGIGTGINPTSFRLEVNGSAAKPGGGSWSASSDRRLKQDIRPYTEGLAAVLSIKPVRFRYNERSGYDTKPEYIGVIAQELQASAPYMVSSVPRTQADGTETPYLAVDNSAMTYMLVNAVKEQQATIERQEAEIKALRSQMDSLLSEFAALKAGLNK